MAAKIINCSFGTIQITAWKLGVINEERMHEPRGFFEANTVFVSVVCAAATTTITQRSIRSRSMIKRCVCEDAE
jgi:hypothetical protein